MPRNYKRVNAVILVESRRERRRRCTHWKTQLVYILVHKKSEFKMSVLKHLGESRVLGSKQHCPRKKKICQIPSISHCAQEPKLTSCAGNTFNLFKYYLTC